MKRSGWFLGLCGALASFGFLTISQADQPRLYDRYTKTSLLSGPIVIDDQFRKDWGQDQVICFNGNPTLLATKLTFNNSSSKSALKRVRTSAESNRLVISVEEKVCTKTEGSYDYVECVQWEDQFIDYNIPSCLQASQFALFRPSDKVESNLIGAIRTDSSQKISGQTSRDIFPKVQLEISPSGRTSLFVIMRLYSAGKPLFSSEAGSITESFTFRGEDLPNLASGNTLKPDKHRDCLIKKSGAGVQVDCSRVQGLVLPYSWFQGGLAATEPAKATTSKFNYQIIDTSTGFGIDFRKLTLSEQIQAAMDLADPRIFGDLTSFISDLNFISHNGATPAATFYDSGLGRFYTATVDFSKRAIEYSYRGKCIKEAQGEPHYPGDDGMMCVEWETGLVKTWNF